MKLNPEKFFKILIKNNIEFFTGVPDSLLKQLCLCFDQYVPEDKHIITANEGNAVALASGYHLATRKLPLVYMQNSGLGNAINPLLSLCDPKVYSIPVLLLIGWRGEPGVRDEPQHITQGEIQLELLKTLNIPFEILTGDYLKVEQKISRITSKAIKNNRPAAILVKKNTFDLFKSSTKQINQNLLSREEALSIILNNLPSKSIIISTTGKTSREIFEIRTKRDQSHRQDFLTVGSMGHCSSIALGIAISKPERKVICIDGDGALIMHMGALSTVGMLNANNFYHILINNQVHDSVGGQKTSSTFINIPTLVKSNSYKHVTSLKNKAELTSRLGLFLKQKGPSFMEVISKPGSRDDLGRPTQTPLKNKKDFMTFVNDET
jgi:phosphonopyruvate decarboxylase